MRKLFTDGYSTDPKAIEKLDNDMVQKLRDLQKEGRTSVRAGELARLLSVDSVAALGSMERVKPRLRKLGLI